MERITRAVIPLPATGCIKPTHFQPLNGCITKKGRDKRFYAKREIMIMLLTIIIFS